jgi:hypothetical protein
MPVPPARPNAIAVALALATAQAAWAQEAVSPPAAGPQEKSFLIPAAEVVVFDLLLSNINRATSGTHDYDVNASTIGHNLRGPWVVDNDPFEVNQFAHPYQGSLYHGAGRSMGLGYWEASALTFAGSLWWEITGERTPPAKNDQVASGIAGSFLGEPLFRMAHLVGDHSTLPPEWRPWLAAAISPPVGLNRGLFGERYGAVFDDHDPAYYSRLHVGAMRTVRAEFAPTTERPGNAAQVDYHLDYGLPGKPGYNYVRPFDYFDFEAALSSANGIEILSTNGLLLGFPYQAGQNFRAIAGLYGGYEYLAPQLYHVSTTSLSLGTTAQWWLARELALQASLLGGIGYAAASSTLRDVDSTEYHYGTAPRAAASLRLVAGDRASLDLSGRYVSLGRIANRAAGRDTMSRVEAAFTWRVSGRHALGLQYAWSHRSATYNAGGERKQTLGQFGIFYTLLGQQDFGTVDWRGE